VTWIRARLRSSRTKTGRKAHFGRTDFYSSITSLETQSLRMNLSTRLLIVTLILLALGVFSLIIGTVAFAAADLVGTALFFVLWLRRR